MIKSEVYFWHTWGVSPLGDIICMLPFTMPVALLKLHQPGRSRKQYPVLPQT